MSMGGARLKNGLTERYNRFVEEYLSNDNDATKAAITAGFSKNSAKQAATRLLNHPGIQKVLEKRRKDLAIKTDITREYVLNGLKQIFDFTDNDKTKIAAAVEINRMCGFNEPEKHLHEHAGTISTVLYLPDNKRDKK